MNTNIQQLKATFTNGDEMILQFKSSTFAGFEKEEMWELTYGERQAGNYGDEEPTKGAYHFMACNCEYFSKDRTEEAIRAFNLRATGDKPWMSTNLSQPLESFLTVSKGHTGGSTLGELLRAKLEKSIQENDDGKTSVSNTLRKVLEFSDKIVDIKNIAANGYLLSGKHRKLHLENEKSYIDGNGTVRKVKLAYPGNFYCFESLDKDSIRYGIYGEVNKESFDFNFNLVEEVTNDAVAAGRLTQGQWDGMKKEFSGQEASDNQVGIGVLDFVQNAIVATEEKKLVLEDGKTYQTEGGEIVKVKRISGDIYCFEGQNQLRYTENGEYVTDPDHVCFYLNLVKEVEPHRSTEMDQAIREALKDE